MKLSRKVTRVLWSAAGFFLLGYLPTFLLGSPTVSMVIAAAVVIPFGSRSANWRRGALRGGILGGIAGWAMFGALTTPLDADVAPPPNAPTTQPRASTGPRGRLKPIQPTTRPAAAQPSGGATRPTAPDGARKSLPSDAATKLAVMLIGGTAAMCSAISAAFAAMAERRRRLIDQQWDDNQPRP